MILAGFPPIPSLVKAPEAAALELAATGARVLEIGAAWGFSTVLMARVAELVVSVDPHEDYQSWSTYADNLQRFGVLERVMTCKGRSQDELPKMLGWGGEAFFDLAFIDGEHTAAAAAHDIGWALRLVRAGGVIAVHDYCVRWPGVVAAVRRLLAGRPAWRIQDLYLVAL